ncbi:2-oxoglutarate synthase subunit KorB [uncultured archaeon]|nr:2-oxoglutarate synthase subunit KorB [uncultured archaeon]
MVTLAELAEPKHTVTWCPGCGDFAILVALKQALVKAGREPHQTVVVSGIGCSGKLPHFIKTYGFEGLHGRSLPAASAIKMANHALTVVDVGGDGDGYGIGMGHFIHTCRRNIDFTYIVHNNQIYGLTTGQTSPTSEKGFKTKSTPEGVLEEPVNPMALAISAGATFVARGFSGNLPHLADLMCQGIQHKGFAIIDVLQPCVTFNKLNTYEYFVKKVYKLDESNHDASDKTAALAKAEEWAEKIPIGVLYKVSKPTYEDGTPQLKEGPLVKQSLKRDVGALLAEFE